MLIPIEQLLARAGAHASELTLIPFGGAGPMLAAMLAETAGMRRVLVPASPGTLCALGALTAAIRRDAMRTVLLLLEPESWPSMLATLHQLSAEAAATVTEMAGPGETEIRYAADLRYCGQSFEITVPVDGADGIEALATEFHAEHERQFGHAEPSAPLQVVSLRVSATRTAPALTLQRRDARPHVPETLGETAVWLGGHARQATLLARVDLEPGAHFAGPAIVVQPDCTVLVPPDWHVTIDELGNIAMELR